jgi:predicted Zn-dependent protease
MRLRLALAVSTLSVVGCITDPVTGEKKFGRDLSDADAEKLGFSYRPAILAQFSGPYPDAELQSHLSSVFLKMAKKSARPDLAWTFTVVNSSVPNAFAIPGGEVFITRGLLARLDDEAEFAVVTGHEIGHIEHRHQEQGMVRDTGVAAVAGIVGEKYGGLVGGLANVGGGLAVARFSRDQEREADVRGVHNSYTAGYDPRRGAEVFRMFLKLKAEEGGGGPLDSWTSDHPLDGERIENVKRLAAEKDPRLKGDAPVPELRVQTGRYAELLAKLRGAHKVYERHDAAVARATQAGGGADAVKGVLGELDACARALPNHALLSSDLGKAYFISGDPARAKQWLERAAGMRQGLLDPEHALGVLALKDQRWSAALDHAERGLAILPEDYRCLYVRGEAKLGLGRTSEARADFQKVAQSAPQGSTEAKAATERLSGR